VTPVPSAIEEWLHSCIRCGNCKYVFKEYSPSCPSGESFNFETYFASGRLWIAHGIRNGELDWDSSLIDPIFACTTCGACEVQCLAPHRENILEVIEELRALAVKELGPLPEHRKFAERIGENHNPYGAPHHSRELAKAHNLPLSASVVYFIGCTSNYREEEIRDSTISLLKKAGVDFTIVDEYCCGSPLLRTGQLSLTSALAEHNQKVIEATGAQRVVTSCSGCYRTLARDYSRMGIKLNAEIMHISQYIRELLRSGRLAAHSIPHRIQVTYHDPCHLGRHMNEYDAPRDVLQQLPITFTEISTEDGIRENAWCCGAGGGCKSAYPDWSRETARIRLNHAQRTGAGVLVSSCPFCKRVLSDAQENDSVEILDLSELVDRLT